MNAERTNGVGSARPRRRIRPANGVSGNACHSGTQPSHHGSNGARPSGEAPDAYERDPMGRFAPGNQGEP
jgi:hypothetical protein